MKKMIKFKSIYLLVIANFISFGLPLEEEENSPLRQQLGNFFADKRFAKKI